jgi:hypothetical protein
VRWLLVASVPIALCAATVMLAVSDPPADGDGATGGAADTAESPPAAPSAFSDPVRAARVRPSSTAEDPPGVNPRAEATGVRVGAASNADATSEAAPPEPGAPGAPGERDDNGLSRAAATQKAGAHTARSTIRDDAVYELAVEVTAAETGNPLPGAGVVVVPAGAQELRLRAGNDGTARFNVPSRTGYALDVKAPGRVRVRRRGVTPSGNARVAISLERGVVVHGFVSDHERRLRGAEVRAVSLEALRQSIPFGPEPPTIESTTTERDGSYVLDCIPRGLACVFIAEARDHAEDRSAIDPQPDPDYDVREDFRLARGIEVVGRVTRTDEKPVADATVFALDAADAELNTRRPSTPIRRDAEELTLLEVLRRFAIGADGDWVPWLCGTRSREDGGFTVVVPEHVDDVRLIAFDAAEGRSAPAAVPQPVRSIVGLTLRGRVRAEFNVLTAKGQPANGMTIKPHFPWETWTAPPRGAGVYGPAEMADGPIEVDVAGPAGAPGTYIGSRVTADSVRWRLQLQDGVIWRGTVADDRGVRIGGATITAGPRTALSDEDGLFEIDGVHPHERELVATAPGHLRTSLDLEPESRLRISVRTPRAASMRMQLVLPRGAAPPTWYRVSTGEDSIALGAAEWEDRFEWADGVVEMRGWGPHDNVFFVFVPGYEAVVREVKLEPGTVFDLGREELKPQTFANVIVVDEAGGPVGDARIDVRPVGDETWLLATPARGAETDAEGRASIGLPTGLRSVEMRASAPGYVSTPHVALPSVSLFTTIVLGRGREFLGQWLTTQGQTARALLLGPDDVVYADVLVARDGTFRAEVPRLPKFVRIVAWRNRRLEPLASASVPSDLAADALFEIR